ncbi:6-phosphogluconolactonase [Leucobacter sp. CSA1]|uniref:6-phosphogluconolactonase n=1 Tax=Leucobacter chromiisoli TaxID=2796471 RepID=A0A934UU33_9MICO|nr:6-phosphogluconolactonase [Leucobacter chromiisoli]MBK0417996.1 6-phosphogluconolactonase [Leucobacter chromiisoli]
MSAASDAPGGAALRLERAATVDALAERVAARVIAVCRARQEAGAVPCVVLTGGSMGRASLLGIAAHAERDSVDWSRVRVLWGDERWVPAGHEERNDRLADELLFPHVEVDPAFIHRVPGSDSGLTLDEAAAQYAVAVDRAGRIDVALNGVGPDGHLCSLFPGRADLLVDGPDAPAAMVVRDSPKPPPERVTLTLPAVRRADRVWLLAAGAEKAEAVARIVRPDADDPLPAARVHGRDETVLWVDAAAGLAPA